MEQRHGNGPTQWSIRTTGNNKLGGESSSSPIIRPDTQAWIGQAWAFFGGACLFDCLAVLWLSLAPGIKWLLLLVVVLTIYVCFALSKMIRDNRDGQVDTSAWILMTWLISGVALAGLVGGIYYLTDDWKMRMIISGGLAWAIESSLVLAKTIRDNEEAHRFSEGTAESPKGPLPPHSASMPPVVLQDQPPGL